jgi:5-methylcytosine-specific restriction endonuclease McrA
VGNLITLKLDASWRPIEIIPAEKGFSMVYSGRAQPVENYTHGPCARFLFPSVIVLKSYIQKKRFVMSPTRRNIYWRDKYTCQYCSGQFKYNYLSLDHVIPKSRGGGRGWLNLVTCCLSCNQKKANKSPSEASMKLIRIPYVPNGSIIDFYHHINVPETWYNFIKR